jgi:hypothetical protein
MCGAEPEADVSPLHEDPACDYAGPTHRPLPHGGLVFPLPSVAWPRQGALFPGILTWLVAATVILCSSASTYCFLISSPLVGASPSTTNHALVKLKNIFCRSPFVVKSTSVVSLIPPLTTHISEQPFISSKLRLHDSSSTPTTVTLYYAVGKTPRHVETHRRH